MLAMTLHPAGAPDLTLPAWASLAYGPPRRVTSTGPEAAAAEERALVEAAQAGDREALQRVLDRVARPLYAAVILPRIGNAADAEDILRDALMRGMERIDTYRWTGAGVFPWFRQIAVNLVIDHVRRNQRRGRLEDRFEEHVTSVEPLHRAGADEALIEAQERAAAARTLQAAMSTLNERYRRAVELRLVEERTREECAAALNVTVGNFDVILHRALAALRKAYGVR
jgi:RNA polymerase sigma-70 factor (ECF subfamily)